MRFMCLNQRVNETINRFSKSLLYIRGTRLNLKSHEVIMSGVSKVEVLESAEDLGRTGVR